MALLILEVVDLFLSYHFTSLDRCHTKIVFSFHAKRYYSLQHGLRNLIPFVKKILLWRGYSHRCHIFSAEENYVITYASKWKSCISNMNIVLKRRIRRQKSSSEIFHVKSIFSSSMRAARTSWSVKAPDIILCFRACTISILSSTVPCPI